MSSLNPWQSPVSARSPRAQLPRARAFGLHLFAWFRKTSDAERPTLLNFVVGAGLYQHAQQLFAATSIGALASIVTLIAILNLRRWGVVVYALLFVFDASAFRVFVVTLAILYTRRFRW